MLSLYRYQDQQGREPFTEWLNGIRDRDAQARIRLRLKNVVAGSWGDSKPVGEGVIELRVHVGAGYRLYCGRHGESLVILLVGGNKASQEKDIRNAKELWSEWKRRQTWTN